MDKGRKRRSGHRVIRDRAAHSPLLLHTSWLKGKRLLLLESLVRSAMHQVLKDYHMPLICWFEFLRPVNLLIMARMGMSVTSLHLISKISVITLIITAKLQFVLDKVLCINVHVTFFLLFFFLRKSSHCFSIMIVNEDWGCQVPKCLIKAVNATVYSKSSKSSKIMFKSWMNHTFESDIFWWIN